MSGGRELSCQTSVLSVLFALLCAPACSAGWFEVVGARSTAAANLQAEGGTRNVTLCDGVAANITIFVEGGTPPWKVAVMRNGEDYTRVIVDSGWLSSTGTAKLRLPLPGRYSLSRVCDLGGCNGTFSDQPVVVSQARNPIAHIIHAESRGIPPVCTDDTGVPGTLVENHSAWSIEVQGVAPIVVQFLRVGHQHEKKHILHWDDDDGRSIKYMTAGTHLLPADFFTSKGLWVLSLISDQSGCPADMTSITWRSTLAVVPRPRVAFELLSNEMCGGQDALILFRLLQGNPPWSVTLKMPDGSLKEMSGLRDRTHVYKTAATGAGNYTVVNASDSACDALLDSLPMNVIEVVQRERVRGRLHVHHIATCPGSFQEIRGEVQGIGPWWLEIRRNGAFWRRIRHPREDASQDDMPQKDGNFSFEVEAAGDYTLYSVTDSRHCSAHGSGRVTVSEKPVPQVRLQQQHACNGDSLTLDVNVSGMCVVTVMATGWHTPRHIQLQLHPSEIPQGQQQDSHSRLLVSNVTLLAGGEALPGQYTITSVRDAECSAATLQVY